MTLTLTITNADRLDNGMPTEFVLNRRGAMIGRSPTCDWSLPDPRQYISSRHCEVTFGDGFYTVKDVSTNGTLLNGAADRMAAPRRVEHGDRFQVGQYEIVAGLSGEAAAAVERQEEEQAQARQAGGWGGWDSHGGGAPPAEPVAPASGSGWDAAPPAADSGWGAPPSSPASSDWGAPPPPSSSDWGAPPAPAASGWDAAPAASSGSDWGAPPPPASGGGGGWGAPPAVPASSPSQSWAPQSGPSLARDAAHVAHARGAAPFAGGGAASLGGGDWTPAAAPTPAVKSTWEAAAPAQQAASGWSSAAPDRPAAPTADDIWGKIADGNVVDWARGGFGQPVEAKRDPLGLDKPAASAALPKATPRMAQFGAEAPGDGWGASAPAPAAAGDSWDAPDVAAPQGAARDGGWGSVPEGATAPPAPFPREAPAPAQAVTPSPPPPPRAPAPAPAPVAAADSGALVRGFAAAAGLRPEQLKGNGADVLERAGALLRQLVAGLVVMVEARARAKSQMGAEATSLNFDGNNPIKFARAPEQALAQLLNPKERGFMEAGPAVEDAFYDLQSHQMATLKAMQGALRATLDRFSPTAIKGRAESKGLMAKIMPGAREAALWQAYEREFGGVAQGSDEAFMDIFAKEFRKAYEEQSNARRAAAPRR